MIASSAEPFPPIEDLVPHGLPLRAVEALVDWAPGRATCRLQVRAHAPFVGQGSVSTLVCLEYMAQTVAACLGYEAYRGGGVVRVGMIVGVRQMDLLRAELIVGDEVHASVERLRGSDEVSTFRGEVRVADTLVATAVMTLVHGERPPTSDD